MYEEFSFSSRGKKAQKLQSRSVLTQCNDEVNFLPLLIHLIFWFSLCFRVSQCIECKMSVGNLAKVFGPTIVQNSSSNVEPMQILQEAKWQPKVGSVGK